MCLRSVGEQTSVPIGVIEYSRRFFAPSLGACRFATASLSWCCRISIPDFRAKPHRGHVTLGRRSSAASSYRTDTPVSVATSCAAAPDVRLEWTCVAEQHDEDNGLSFIVQSHLLTVAGVLTATTPTRAHLLRIAAQQHTLSWQGTPVTNQRFAGFQLSLLAWSVSTETSAVAAECSSEYGTTNLEATSLAPALAAAAPIIDHANMSSKDEAVLRADERERNNGRYADGQHCHAFCEQQVRLSTTAAELTPGAPGP